MGVADPQTEVRLGGQNHVKTCNCIQLTKKNDLPFTRWQHWSAIPPFTKLLWSLLLLLLLLWELWTVVIYQRKVPWWVRSEESLQKPSHCAAINTHTHTYHACTYCITKACMTKSVPQITCKKQHLFYSPNIQKFNLHYKLCPHLYAVFVARLNLSCST